MRWSPIVLTSAFALFTSGVIAHPMPSNATTSHFLNKRTLVCGSELRGAIAEDCVPQGINFALSGTSAVVEQTGIKAKPAKSACDHTVEIQVLQKALIVAKVCDVVNARVALGESRATIMQQLFTTMNSEANLLFLDSDVNGRKASFVQNAIAGHEIADDGLNKAVISFLGKVGAESRRVATALDTEVQTIIAAATTKANAFVIPAAKRLSAAQVKEKALKDAVAAHAKLSRTPVTSLWNLVLAARVA